MPIATGTWLGPYEILAPLGAGGMGEVYRARDSRLGRDVAIKVLPEHLTRDADLLARLGREARAVAVLNHPNIVTLHSIEQAGDTRFLTMELVEGESLAKLIPPGGLSLGPAVEVAIALAEALAAAHQKQILHRDLKPGNVMLTEDGRVKVLDFGLAKSVASVVSAEPDATRTVTAATSLTGAGTLVGTVPYMAPEQLCGRAADVRTDLFALGVVMYELLTGRRPFGGESVAELSTSILRDPPPPLIGVRPEVPDALEHVVRRCLEKEPAGRFQSAWEVRDALRQIRRRLERHDPDQANGGPGTHAPPTAAAPPAPRLAIAVLPFANMTGDEENEYFADGLAEELLNVLAKIRTLRVAARSSSFQFKGHHQAAEVIGRKLNVSTLLEGSVRKFGRHVRIAVHLVNAVDGYHLWSETYDRTLEDILALQGEIAQSVVMKLRATLMAEEPEGATGRTARAEVAEAGKGRGASGEAHRLYVQGRYFIDRRTRPDSEKGMGYLREALEIDPGHALAWAELSRAHSNAAGHGWVPVAEGYVGAREAAERALALEPGLAEGHASLAWVRITYDWDWTGAEGSILRALELAPGSPWALRVAGVMAQNVGRLEEAMDCYRRALEQDPLSSSAYQNLGSCYRAADRLADAEAAFRKALELAPQRVGTRASLALVLFAQGRGREAPAEAEREPHEAFRLWALAVIHHGSGRRVPSNEALRALIAKHSADSAAQIATVHAVRDEHDAAFEWLERAYAQRDGGLAKAKCEPLFRALHGDPRWRAFMGRMGFGTG